MQSNADKESALPGEYSGASVRLIDLPQPTQYNLACCESVPHKDDKQPAAIPSILLDEMERFKSTSKDVSANAGGKA